MECTPKIPIHKNKVLPGHYLPTEKITKLAQKLMETFERFDAFERFEAFERFTPKIPPIHKNKVLPGHYIFQQKRSH